MRKECRIKTFDGLGPFSYVRRMIRNEPNTNTTETGKSETVASSVDLCEPQLGHAGSSLTEEFIEPVTPLAQVSVVEFHKRG